MGSGWVKGWRGCPMEICNWALRFVVRADRRAPSASAAALDCLCLSPVLSPVAVSAVTFVTV